MSFSGRVTQSRIPSQRLIGSYDSRVLITVKAAPNPSDKYGETVCVAGINADPMKPGWVRLYPINFRELGTDESFKKYDIATVNAKPARRDPRRESWKPVMQTMVRETP